MTDTNNITVIGELRRPSLVGPSLWADVKVLGDTAYVVSEAPGHGLQVFDLQQLRQLTTFTVFDHIQQMGKYQAHNFAICESCRSKTGVVMGSADSCDGGLHLLDLSRPRDPVFKACYSDAGYIHDCQVSATRVKSSLIYLIFA